MKEKRFRIKRNTSGKVRTSLCAEDCYLVNTNALKDLGLVNIDWPTYEGKAYTVMVFKEPFRVPRFNVFYASKIKNAQDPYLGECIKRLLYINPDPDKLLVKKLAEYIGMFFVAQKTVESDVGVGRTKQIPVIPFKVLHTAVQISLGSMKGYVPDTEDMVVWSREENPPRALKISYRSRIKSAKAKKYFESAIHLATEVLIDKDTSVKVTGPRIQSTKLVETHNKVASTQTIRKYMSDRTKRVIEEHNSYAMFKSENTANKFKQYLKLDPRESLDNVAAELNISKSKAQEFRKYKLVYEMLT